MRMMSGKVVRGSVVVDGLDEPLTEGSIVTVLAPEEDEVVLSDLDRAELLASAAEIDRGEFVSVDALFQILAEQNRAR